MDLPNSEQSVLGTRDWPHAPPHRLAQSGVYFVTARTRDRLHVLADDELKTWFELHLLELVGAFGWQIEAWCVLSNHYRFVAHSPANGDSAVSLRPLLQKLHSLTTKESNRREQVSGRSRLWQNYRETHLTYQRSYLARLNYVHQNAVHHGLARVGSEWPWCSAGKFKASVSPAWLKTIASFKYDEIAAEDGD